MRYRIVHETRYHYSKPVFIEPQMIRLRPRCDGSQAVLAYDVRVGPEPAGISWGLDAENNPYHLIWFNDLLESVQVRSLFTVETLRSNPFEGLWTGKDDRLPLSLPKNERAALGPYLAPASAMTEADRTAIAEVARSVEKRAEGRVMPYLNELNRLLYEKVETIIRNEQDIQPVAQTLGSARGACRDTALVFMQACRVQGIPARFVSGCQEGDPDQSERDLHAWAEVYLPGFGWRGFDPTHGLAVADRHIPYAAAALPENAAPLAGTFRGTGATSLLQHAIELTLL